LRPWTLLLRSTSIRSGSSSFRSVRWALRQGSMSTQSPCANSPRFHPLQDSGAAPRWRQLAQRIS
jgi:hypothetical protein